MNIIEPPTRLPPPLWGQWFELPYPDAFVRRLCARWDCSVRGPWSVSQRSTAAYAYRDHTTGFTLVAKFYAAKSGHDSARRRAWQEFEQLERVREVHRNGAGFYAAARALDAWDGVLLVQYVPGQTLQSWLDERGREGLRHRLDLAAGFLVHLHGLRAVPCPAAHGEATAYCQKVVRQLRSWGLLHRCPRGGARLEAALRGWRDESVLQHFVPSIIHGDPTTTNLLVPQDGVVWIDWERSRVSDPAADVGRLMAEVDHGTGGVEAGEYLHSIYAAATAPPSTFHLRVAFHRATSLLRIARNGWLTVDERVDLVERAVALLESPGSPREQGGRLL